MAKPIYQGQTAEIEVSIVPENNAFHLDDSTTTFEAEFYVQGTNKNGDKSVKLQKNQVFFKEGEHDKFTAHVPTSDLLGTLAITVTGTYKDMEHSTSSNVINLPFVTAIKTNIEVKSKYI